MHVGGELGCVLGELLEPVGHPLVEDSLRHGLDFEHPIGVVVGGQTVGGIEVTSKDNAGNDRIVDQALFPRNSVTLLP